MNHLHRELAPICAAAWAEIDGEASQTLKRMLAGRKLFDFAGPHGWQTSSINLGRVKALRGAPEKSVLAQQRVVQPLIEFRVPFELARDELDAAERGAADIDLDPVTQAARTAALTEDQAIFNGFAGGSIAGVMTTAEHPELKISDDYIRYPDLVADATNTLRSAGIAGPYAIALGPRCYTGLTRTTEHGYPVMEHLRRMLDGPIVWAPALDGAVVVSLRGGDFVLHVGQDFSIGYAGHTDTTVKLYIEESLTFMPFGPEAAVPLRYPNRSRK